MTNRNGLFITIEGIDGCGKSTLIAYLNTILTQHQHQVLITKEPGGSALGKQLRGILQHQPWPLNSQAEFLLFAADRAQHMHEVVGPALQAGKIVISDRCADSSLAYQGYGLGLDKEMIKQVNSWAMGSITPDIVLYLRLSPELALERIKKDRPMLTSFEQRDGMFWSRVAQGFDEIFAQRNNVIIVDASPTPEKIQENVWKALQPLL